MEALEALQKCTVEGTIVKLPPTQLERGVYVELKKKLEMIGGKWKGGKTQGFVFAQDPSTLLQEVAAGGNRNLKKEFQFFETPDTVADEMVRYLCLKESDSVFEPSAGQGALIRAMRRAGFNSTVHVCELMPLNQKILGGMAQVNFLAWDFLTLPNTIAFDKIIANPPFAGNQDIDHIYRMYDFLVPGGRLVTLASTHWSISTNTKEREFRQWLDTLNASIERYSAGTFKQSGTNVETSLIVIDK